MAINSNFKLIQTNISRPLPKRWNQSNELRNRQDVLHVENNGNNSDTTDDKW